MDEHKKKSTQDLDRTTETTTFQIESLLADVKRGRVRIPPFQTPFRWEDHDRQKLLDSLYRGYPIGILLFWETHAPPSLVRLGRFSIHASERNDALWVVDGQQRILALLDAFWPSEEDSAFFFDLDHEDPIPFKKAHKKQIDAEPSRWLPMTHLLDPEHLSRWLLEQQPPIERRQQAFHVAKRLREYEIPAYILHTTSEDIPREVFERTHSTAKAMRQDEVFDAIYRARAPQDAPTDISQIAEHLQSLSFGNVPHPLLFRLLFAILGRTPSRRHLFSTTLPQAPENAAILTAEAAKRAVIFLKEKAAFPHIKLLPYPQSFVLLGKFFHHHPTPLPRSQELLVRWLWRDAISKKHRTTALSESNLLQSIDPNDEEKTIQIWLSSLGEKKEDSPSLQDPFHWSDPDGKLLTTALLHHEPRSLLDHKKLSLADLLAPNHPNIRRFVKLTTSNKSPSTWQQSIVNRLLHPPLRHLKAHLSDASAEVLHSHFLTTEMLVLFTHDDLDGFFQQRAEWMQRHCLSFFRRHARWEETDRPSMRYLLTEDESW